MEQADYENIFELHRLALSHDFLPTNNYPDEEELLPSEVLKKITNILGASGGNFTIYHADDDYLDVRGWHSPQDNQLGYKKFREKMRELSARNNRLDSSSYRTFHYNRSVLVDRSEIDELDKKTLDLATLELKAGLSAAAVPLKYHGRSIGVLHMDSNDSETMQFDEHHIRILENISEILTPILHHNLVIEKMTRIAGIVMRSARDNRTAALNSVCKLIGEILFVPWVGIWLADDAQVELFRLNGHNGILVNDNELESINRVEINNNGSALIEVFRKTSRNEHIFSGALLNDTDTNIFQFSQGKVNVTGGSTGIAFALTDTGQNINGVLLFLERTYHEYSESYKRLVRFVAGFLSLTLGALEQHEAQAMISYETAAHEFNRNLNNIDNTQKRLRSIYSKIDIIRKNNQPADDDTMYKFQVIVGALASHVQTARNTQQNLVGNKEGSVVSQSNHNNNPVLRQARIRQQEINCASNNSIMDIKDEINDICNGFTKWMDKSAVRWDKINFDLLPKRMQLDKQNFNLVFGNIIENSVKYSKANTQIRITICRGELVLSILVVNTGPLIDIKGPERSDIFLPRIRGRYAEKWATGKGLGLWEAREVARMWGGDIWLKFAEPIPVSRGDQIPWSRNGFVIDIPISRHILTFKTR